jgi:tape measure domain-containing protein
MKPLEQEVRFKYNAAQMRRFRQEMKESGAAGEKGFKKTDMEAGRLEQTMRRIKLAAFGMISALGFGAALTAIGKVNGDLEQMKVAFEVMLGSAEKGKKVLDELFLFTETTPFQFEEVAAAGRILLAMGSSSGKLQGELRMLGDIASGTNTPLAELALIFGKIRSKGRVTMEELNQLSERGIIGINTLAEHFGKTTTQMGKMIEKGEVGFPLLMELMAGLTSEGGKFFQLTDKQSATFLGMVSTMKDLGLGAFRDATNALFETLKVDLKAIKSRIETARASGELARMTEKVSDALKTGYEITKRTIGFLIEHRGAIARLVRAYIEFKVAMVVMKGVAAAYRITMMALHLANIAYSHSTMAARIATNAFKASLVSTGIGALVVALGFAFEAFYQYATAASDAETATDSLMERVYALKGAYVELTKKQAQAQIAANVIQATALNTEIDRLRKEKESLEAQFKETLKQDAKDRNISNPYDTPGQRMNLDAQKKIDEQVAFIQEKIKEIAAQQVALILTIDNLDTLDENLGDPGETPVSAEDPSKKKKKKVSDFEDPIKEIIENVFENAVNRFTDELNTAKVDHAKGLISDADLEAAALAAAERYQEEFMTLFNQLAGGISFQGFTIQLTAEELSLLKKIFLDAYGDAGRVIDDVTAKADKNKKKISETATTIRALKTALNGMRQLGASLGIISDGLSKVIDGALNAADALVSLGETKDAIASGDLSGSAGSASLAAGYIGIATSVASMITPLLSGGDKDKVEDAIKENTRRIEKSIKELAESLRFGEDLTGDEINAIASAFLTANGGLGNLSVNSGPNQYAQTETRFENLFDLLDDAGIDTAGFRSNLERYMSDMAVSSSLNNKVLFANAQANMFALQGDIRSLLDSLLGSQGMFNPGTTSGVLGGASFLSSFGGADEKETFDSILDGLLGLSGISEEMLSFLSSIKDLSDPLSTSGRAAIKALVESLARDATAGGFNFGSMSPGDVDEILNTLLGFGESSAPDEYTRSVQIARSITEVQSNELIAIQETALLYLRQIRDGLSGASGSGGTGSGGRGGSNPSASPISISVGVTGGLSDSLIDETLDRIEQRLRELNRTGS